MICLAIVTGITQNEQDTPIATNFVKLLNALSKEDAAQLVVKLASDDFPDAVWIEPACVLELPVELVVEYLEDEGYTVVLEKRGE